MLPHRPGVPFTPAAVLTISALVTPLAALERPGPGAGGVVINEIHYAPADKTRPEEFVELHNPTDGPVDLSGWKLAGAVKFLFPESVSIAPGGFLVVAQAPDALPGGSKRQGVLGPFSGRLSNSGETLELRASSGDIVDRVEYGNSFPWPVVGGGSGRSIELVDPSLDNSLGGSWRPAGSADALRPLVRDGATWRYFRGVREPSGPSAWRRLEFDDSSWSRGALPIGYGERGLATPLDDMRGRYTTVYLRRSFEVADALPGALFLEVSLDDGFNAWINGVHVASANVAAQEVGHDGFASSTREDLGWQSFALADAARYLRRGRNVIAIQLFNKSIARSTDAFLDVRLAPASTRLAATPGAANSLRTTEFPAQIQAVRHTPRQPRSGDTVTITATVTHGPPVASVSLLYQIVEPGDYVPISDPRYETRWKQIAMTDDGQGSDATSQDGVFTADLPPTVQTHRRLIRYRVRVESERGVTAQAPYPEDPQRNFAYFVYDGVPAWRGAIEPGSSSRERRRVMDYSAEVLRRLPVYHLIAKQNDVEDATWRSGYAGSDFPWTATLVHDGDVYDPIGFRARGGVWRYAMGKNMWKFNFHRSHRLRARDDHGRAYRTRWDKLNLSAVIQQGVYGCRGEQGLFEATTYKLFNLAGVPAPATHYVQLRIVDSANESGSTQYDGDFWGLYLAIEQPDGRFLDEHRLPDGNLYKMERGGGELNHRAAGSPGDGSDLRTFLRGYQSRKPPESWWRANLDLERYYSYRTVVEAVRHYDIGHGKNYFYYRDPKSERWSVFPWDVDLTWCDRMFGNGNEPFHFRVLSTPSFALEYRNRVREIRDLLFNEEQVDQLIDELVSIIDEPRARSIAAADRALWDYHPVMSSGLLTNSSKTRPGLFYRQSRSGDLRGMVDYMKKYARQRMRLLDSIARDNAIPETPRARYLGLSKNPIGFRFAVHRSRDPRGVGSLDAIEWRVGEVASSDGPAFVKGRPRPYEIEPVWESGPIDPASPEIVVPAEHLQPGRRYRLRSRRRDRSGRWSHWSAPVEFK